MFTQTDLFESPNLPLIYFCLWGLRKSVVYKRKVDTPDDLLACILNAAACIKKFFIFFYLFNQQSECNVFHKLICWQESSLWTFFWRDEVPSNEGISYSWLQVSWPSSFQSPWDIVPWSGFGWDCSLARCLLLLLWMTSWTVDWCNKYCIAVFESESSWWSGFRLQVGCRSCFVVGRVEIRPCAGQGRWRSTALSEGI